MLYRAQRYCELRLSIQEPQLVRACFAEVKNFPLRARFCCANFVTDNVQSNAIHLGNQYTKTKSPYQATT